MHYTDKEQLDRNTLELGMYIHEVMGTSDDLHDHDIHIEISSIQNCRYFSPRILYKMLKNPNKYFKNIKEINSLDRERWFIAKIKQTDWDDILIENIEYVSEDADDILRLH